MEIFPSACIPLFPREICMPLWRIITDVSRMLKSTLWMVSDVPCYQILPLASDRMLAIR